MPQDPNRSHENDHLRAIQSYQGEVSEAYQAAIEEIFLIVAGTSIVSQLFRLQDYPLLKARMEEVLARFRERVAQVLSNGVRSEWRRSDTKNAAVVMKKYGEALGSTTLKELLTSNVQGMEKQLARKTGPKRLTLSDRVWNLTKQFQAEIESTLYVGTSKGQAATTMARSLKTYLKEPDRLYRRVRDAEGVLQLSKAAKEYKPGPGVYRSSFKNAMRLARTETNAAYRAADHERWKRTAFVLGVEVKLSNGHPRADMCDHLVGIFPPDYKHTGFHLQCLCYSVPLLPSKEEFAEYQRAVLSGTEKGFQFKGRVQEIHAGAKQWIANNSEKIAGWKRPPLFMQDNPKLVPF